MFKILMNLRKTMVSVIFIILLLCVQAWADLSLPDYTSKIVNVGIQQGGIENVAIEAIRQSQMELLLRFTKEDREILNAYILLDKENLEQKEYEEYVTKYPKLAEEPLYVRKTLNNEQKEQIHSILAKPLMLLSILNNEEMEEKIKEQIMPVTKNMQPMAWEEVLKAMPEEQLETLLSPINEQLDKMSQSILEQAAVNYVKQEYQAIGINTEDMQNRYIFLKGLQMLGIALISMVSAVMIMLLSSRVAAYLGRTLRDKVFQKVMQFSTKEFREFSTASLITRSTNDIQQIQGLIAMLFRVVVYAPIMGIGGFIRVLANGNTSMAWIIGLAVLCIMGIVLILFLVAMPKFKKLQELVDKLNLVAREILTGLPVIRAFNTQKREEARFDVANQELKKTNIFVNRAMSIMMPALMLVMNSIMLLIIWVGGHSVEEGIIQVGDMMAFIQYTMHIVMSFLVISMISIMLPRAAVSAKRINEVLETNPSIQDKEQTQEFLEEKTGWVEFKNVSFRYPDADSEILTDINFTAKPGETTAIIGSTGSGKSTVVNLIPRFYDVTRGELLIDGINVKEVAQKELRKKVGFVPQKGILFSGTIESNIKYGNPQMSDEQMMQAAQIAQAEEFIEAKKEKYKSPIAQGGNNVSGGQKQRLSIARAIAIDPEILVFDDSFSALDLKTDRKLREALALFTSTNKEKQQEKDKEQQEKGNKKEKENKKENKKEKGKTVIIVAQRISTIMNAEQIIVLEEGKMVGKGTHEELLQNCETYRQIATSQLSEEELFLGTEEKNSSKEKNK